MNANIHSYIHISTTMIYELMFLVACPADYDKQSSFSEKRHGREDSKHREIEGKPLLRILIFKIARNNFFDLTYRWLWYPQIVWSN